MLEYDGELLVSSSFDGELNLSDFNFEGELFVGEVIKAETHETYNGEINIIPLVEEDVVLNTMNKIIENNITVFAIPYFEVDNNDGTTVVIGG